MARKMTRGARIAQIQVNKLLAASATPPTPDPVPYAETLAFLERVAADFEPHADHDPVSADTVTYCRVAAAAVQAFRKAVPTPTAGEKGTHAQPVGRWEEAPRYVWICLCGVRWNSSVADCSKCRSVRPETAAAPVRPVEGLSGRALAEAWDASTPQHGHAWANLSVSVRQHVCDFARRIAGAVSARGGEA